MGKQSSRLYYQGKDHKEIYYQGHYHDAMYIGSKLVWEKIKGETEAVEYIWLITYVNGKYYVVADTTVYITTSQYPVLYEGRSLSAMKKRGRIWGDDAVKGTYYAMYGNDTELIVVRTNGDSSISSSSGYVASIPLSKNGADMENITYGFESLAGEYVYARYDNYVYGNGNYYNGRLKNGNALAFDNSAAEHISYSYQLRKSGNRIFAINVKFLENANYSVSDGVYDIHTWIGELDDDNDIFVMHKLDLTPMVDYAVECFVERYPTTKISVQSLNIYDRYASYGNYMPVGNDIFYAKFELDVTVTVPKDIYSTQTVVYSFKPRIKIDLNKFAIVDIDEYKLSTDMHYFLRPIIVGDYRVQLVRELYGNTYVVGAYISYGLVGGDYMDDVYFSVNDIDDSDASYTLTESNLENSSSDVICAAKNGNELIVGIRVGTGNSSATVNNFLVIDTESNTAKYTELDIKAYVDEEE